MGRYLVKRYKKRQMYAAEDLDGDAKARTGLLAQDKSKSRQYSAVSSEVSASSAASSAVSGNSGASSDDDEEDDESDYDEDDDLI